MSQPTWVAEFVGSIHQKLAQQFTQVTRCAGLLTADQLWWRANEHTNSVGNLLLHLTGNLRQWIIGGLDGQQFTRDRPAEFAARGPQPTEELLAEFSRTVRTALDIIRRADQARLERRYRIQDYDASGVAAVFHVAEHFSFHTGQIVHITKQLRDVDLSLYDAQGHRHDGAAP